MSYIDYLSRFPVDHQIVYKLKELMKKTFVGQVCLNRKARYIIAFIMFMDFEYRSELTDKRKCTGYISYLKVE